MVIAMFWLKNCPRCNTGDLWEGKDMYGSYVACLQCSYYLTEAEEVVLRYASARGPQSDAGEKAAAEPALAGVSR